MTIYIGVDPGQKGAIAALTSAGGVYYDRLPLVGNTALDRKVIKALIYDWKLEHGDGVYAVVEKTSPLPASARLGGKKGGGGTAKTNWWMGYHMGAWESIFELLDVKHEFVAPATWQAKILVGIERKKGIPKDAKRRAAIAARRLFPSVTTKNDNALDALLLAEYARRRFSGETTT